MTNSKPTKANPFRFKSWKVLVIEDDARWRALIELLLQDDGHVVLTASDGQAGLALTAERPDVILCDVEMPQFNGFSVLETLRLRPGLGDIPFIFLTGKNARSDQRKGMVLGADDYLTKPFQREELLDAIASVLAKRESLTQRLRYYTEEYRREIAAPWAHELLTPLNGIIGIADLLEAEPGAISQAEMRELARSLRVSARRQQAFARKLTQHFQLERFRESGWSDPVAVAEAGECLAEVALGVAEQLGRSAGLRLENAAASAAISPVWLRAAAGELIENAFKFSPPGSPVTVTGCVVGRNYRIEVKDCGPGMSADEQRNFAAFRQFSRAAQEQHGLGLGLAIAHNIARLHQGSLVLSTGAAGTGLCAALELPLAE